MIFDLRPSSTGIANVRIGFLEIVMKSRMTGDCHVRFCEGLGVKLPRPTRLCTEAYSGCKTTGH